MSSDKIAEIKQILMLVVELIIKFYASNVKNLKNLANQTKNQAKMNLITGKHLQIVIETLSELVEKYKFNLSNAKLATEIELLKSLTPADFGVIKSEDEIAFESSMIELEGKDLQELLKDIETLLNEL